MVDIIYIRKGKRAPRERSLILELVPPRGVLHLTLRKRAGERVKVTHSVFEAALEALVQEAEARNIKAVYVEGAWE